jgi:hypothetical protein
VDVAVTVNATEFGSSAVRISTGARGTMAAVIQKNDAARDIWKSPAGPAVTLVTQGFEITLPNSDAGGLKASGINLSGRYRFNDRAFADFFFLRVLSR